MDMNGRGISIGRETRLLALTGGLLMTAALAFGGAGSLTVKLEQPLERTMRYHFDNMQRFDVTNAEPMDLSRAAGVKFELRCEDPSVLTGCWLLFKTGDGYYRAAAEIPPKAGVWTEVTVLRKGVRLYHWNTHISRCELEADPKPTDLPDWRRVSGFQIVFSLAIDRTSPDATVSARGFEPVAEGSAEARAAEEAFAAAERRRTDEVAAFPSRSGERRFLATHVYGLDWDWDATCRMLAERGITDVIPLTSYAGRSYFKSAFEPPHALIDRKGDALRQCIAACRKHGLKCHPWRCSWVLGEVLNETDKAELVRDKRLQVGFDGQFHPDHFLCPTHPVNVRHEIEAMMELADMGASGVMLDYFRYANRKFCYCERCREKFESTLGRRLSDWPKCLTADAELNVKWQAFRRGVLTEILRTVRAEMRRRAPQVELSAALFAVIEGAYEVGQDWPSWGKEGLLDFMFPMCYFSSAKQLKREVGRLQDATRGAKGKLVPMISLACGAIPFNDPVEIARQISVVRGAGIDDLAFFRLEEYLPYAFDMLRKGPLK